MDACGRCGGSVREVVFTTAGHGEEQRAVFREAPLAVDGWVCTSCGWTAVPRRMSPEEITSLLERGARHAGADQLDDAEYCFLRAATSWPDYPPALGNLGEVTRIRANGATGEQRRVFFEQAAQLLARAVDNDAGVAVPFHFKLELARVEALRGNETSALKRLDAIVADSEITDDHRSAARELAAQVRSGRALFTRASELASPLIMLEGRSAGPLSPDERDAFDQAKTLLERAWQRDQTAFSTQWLLGKIHQREGDMPAAVGAFARAYELNPDQPDVCREYGLALLQAGRAEDAVPVAEHACELRPDDAGLRSNLALTLLLAGDVEGASTNMKRALRMDPDDAITARLAKVVEQVEQGAPRPRSLADLERRAR